MRKSSNGKNRVVTDVRRGLEGLIASNQIQVFRGYGKFISPNEIKVTGQDNAELSAKISSSQPVPNRAKFPSFPFDYERIHDSTSMLENKKFPKKSSLSAAG